MLPASAGLTLHQCFVYLRNAVYKLTGQKKIKIGTQEIIFLQHKVHEKHWIHTADLCGEALTRAGPPAEPDVYRLRPLKLLMKLPQHWRLRTNKHRLARLTLEQQTSDLGPQILYQLWKWKKLDMSLNMRQKSSETENCTISARCARVLFVIDKQPVMYRWFGDTVVTPVGLNFNCTVGAYLKVFPYSLLLCVVSVLWLTSAQTCLEIPGDFQFLFEKTNRPCSYARAALWWNVCRLKGQNICGTPSSWAFTWQRPAF